MNAAASLPRPRFRNWMAGRGDGRTIVAPLAFRVAARISERPLESFLREPTQLANGLMELFEGVGPDAIYVTLADGAEQEAVDYENAPLSDMGQGGRLVTSLEATSRLRATLGDRAVLIAGLTGPATLAAQLQVSTEFEAVASGVNALGRKFLEAGCDAIVLFEEPTAAAIADPGWQAALRTLSNATRFFRAGAFLVGATGPLPSPSVARWPNPSHVQQGLVMTDREVPMDASIRDLMDWIQQVAG